MPFVDVATLYGRCLYTLRRAAELSQVQFAQELDISSAALSQLELGKTTPSFRLSIEVGERLREHGVIDNSSGILRLLDAAARDLHYGGAWVVNRPLDFGEPAVPLHGIDRVVGRLYDAARPRYEIVPVRVMTMPPRRRG